MQTISTPVGLETAVFGGGCFWCTEAVFTSIEGVIAVQSGYCGGHLDHPTYEQVCCGTTGHIEVVRIEFDPSVVGYESLLEAFFDSHDPTTPGRQGNDVGPQYQSAVFWQTAAQREIATAMIRRIDATQALADPLCTQLLPAAPFWPAEAMHASYFALHPEQGYCQFVIAPKVLKFRKTFAGRLKNQG